MKKFLSSGGLKQLEVKDSGLQPGGLEKNSSRVPYTFQVLSIRQHHDPSNEIPLYANDLDHRSERMQRREAEEAKLKEEAARHDRELAKKRAVEEWEKQKQAERQRMERYEEKRRAVARVADGRDPHSWEG
ncbi:Calmodulin [Durusdinium trenchii]|uniref:Calmodulin n=1 Tax=Durusdinium trenchii TaxID=1381693 RepID=A0ABP0MD95_9DINO